jgi:PhnB protein
MKHHEQTSKGIRTSVAPLLSVRRGAHAIDFYKRAFGAEELLRIEDDKGEVVARMAVDGAEFWLADESPQHANFSPESLGGGSVRMVLTVENPDAVFEKAVAAGATVVWPVADQRYGWRIGRLVDPFGHHWEIGKPLSNGAKEAK